MSDRYELKRPVFFVGFMGAGKTSVARRLGASVRHVASVDMDTYLERREGKRVKAHLRGVRARRVSARVETDVLGELAEPRSRCSCRAAAAWCTRDREPRHPGAGRGSSCYLQVIGRRGGRTHQRHVPARPLFQDLDAARERCERARPAVRATWPTPRWTRRARAWRPSRAEVQRRACEGRCVVPATKVIVNMPGRGALRRAHRRRRAGWAGRAASRGAPRARSAQAQRLVGDRRRQRGAAVPAARTKESLAAGGDSA